MDDSQGIDRPVELEDGAALDAFVTEHDPAVIEFYTKGCAVCQSMAPVLGNLARSTPAAVGTCNPQQDLDLVETYDIRSVPTIVVFVEGEPVEHIADGFVPTDRLVEFVEDAMN